MPRNPLRPLLLASALSLGFATMTSHAQTPVTNAASASQGTLLSVSAQAEASRVPDVASLSAGVVTRAEDANAATRAAVALASVSRTRRQISLSVDDYRIDGEASVGNTIAVFDPDIETSATHQAEELLPLLRERADGRRACGDHAVIGREDTRMREPQRFTPPSLNCRVTAP